MAVSINCQVSAFPSGILDITFNNNEISGSPMSSNVYIRNQTTIVIKSLTSADFGEYKCVATNNVHGISMTDVKKSCPSGSWYVCT